MTTQKYALIGYYDREHLVPTMTSWYSTLEEARDYIRAESDGESCYTICLEIEHHSCRTHGGKQKRKSPKPSMTRSVDAAKPKP